MNPDINFNNDLSECRLIILPWWTFLPLGLLGICYQSFTETCLWRSVRNVAGTYAPKHAPNNHILIFKLFDNSNLYQVLSFTEFHLSHF